MESFPPLPSGLGAGQRALAAIVFTDVVGFSARMQVDEAAVLTLLERDFASMSKLCVQHSGAVLKRTGDGLLLYFSSAVQAVACALRMQNYFARKSRLLPPEEILTHRIGIHLGDVFLNDQDVMGDGVNIAARLQAEAEPGGICISQTVYDVVKNKLALQVTLLGPRELKNIAEAIPIYRILLDAQTLKLGEEAGVSGMTAAPYAPTTSPSPSPPARTRTWIVLGGGMVILLLLALALPGWRADYKAQQERQRIETTRAALIALLDAPADAEPGYHRQEMNRVLAGWREELRANRSFSFEECDLQKLGESLTVGTGPTAKTDTALRGLALERLNDLFAWMESALKRFDKAHPLKVSELAGAAPRELEVFAGRNRGVYVVEGGAVRWRNWTNLRPAYFGALTVGVLLDTPTLPPREVLHGAEIFAVFYGLPEMNSALRYGSLRRAAQE